VFWILQNNIYSEDGWTKLVEALERLGISYSVHKCLPFVGTLSPEPQPPPGPVIVMGSYTLARVAQERGWKPGAFVNDNLDYEVQIKHWGDYFLNNNCWVGPVKDVPEQTHPFFIRPTTDSKAFTGYITDWPEFLAWRERLLALRPEDGATMDGDTRVMVGRKYDITREYRTWIVDGRVVTASLYKQGPHKYARPEVDERVINFARNMAMIWEPARAFVLDVFEVNGSLYIGEVNNLNAAGFYAADMQKLVAALDGMKV
jgi:hypothetical protein